MFTYTPKVIPVALVFLLCVEVQPVPNGVTLVLVIDEQHFVERIPCVVHTMQLHTLAYVPACEMVVIEREYGGVMKLAIGRKVVPRVFVQVTLKNSARRLARGSLWTQWPFRLLHKQFDVTRLADPTAADGGFFSISIDLFHHSVVVSERIACSLSPVQR